MSQAVRYQIRVRVQGELAPGWSAVLADLAVAPVPTERRSSAGSCPTRPPCMGSWLQSGTSACH